MTIDPSELQQLQQEFGITLPRSYVKFLEQYPQVLTEPCIADRPDLGAPCDEWALKEFEPLRELNREFQDDWAEMEFNEKERPFPTHRFLIGTIDGDLLAVNTRPVVPYRVLIYKHEYGWWLPFAITMRGLTRRLVRRTE